MQKATATYVAPVGDSKVVEMGGVTFFAGKAVELNSDEHAHLMSKLGGNAHFDVEMGEDDKKVTPAGKKKRGRPSAADRAAAKAAAENAENAAKVAADKATEAKADLEATEKAATANDDGGKQAPKQTRDMGAGIREAGDHDFEQDRRDKIAGREALDGHDQARGPNQTAGQNPKGGDTQTGNAGQTPAPQTGNQGQNAPAQTGTFALNPKPEA